MSIDHVRFFSQVHNQDHIILIDYIDQVILDDITIYRIYHLIMKEFFVLIFHIQNKFHRILMKDFLDYLRDLLLLIDDYS